MHTNLPGILIDRFSTVKSKKSRVGVLKYFLFALYKHNINRMGIFFFFTHEIVFTRSTYDAFKIIIQVVSGLVLLNNRLGNNKLLIY